MTGPSRADRPLIGVYPTLEVRALAPSVDGGRRPPCFPFSEPGLRLTHLGRGAVWLALRAIGLGPGRRLAMPAYHCGAEVDAARLAGVEVVFYRVTPSLEVDEDDLARVAAAADAAYLISHFGFPLPSPPPDVPVVVDVAHGLFSAGADGTLVRNRRRANYQALADTLAPLCPEPYRSLPPGVCPLYFPVRCPDRDRAVSELLRRGVRAVEIWPVAHPLLDADRFGELARLRREMLALPVHQDLEPWHVQVVVEAAREVLSPP